MVPRNTFFIGLSMILAYKQDKRARRLRIAKAMLKRVKKWVKSSNPNVLHFLHLLEAQLLHVEQRYDKARQEFTLAVKTAMRAGFKLDYALANELCALFYAGKENPLHDMTNARFYMERAVESYAAYGATNKVRHMTVAYPHLLEAAAK